MFPPDQVDDEGIFAERVTEERIRLKNAQKTDDVLLEDSTIEEWIESISDLRKWVNNLDGQFNLPRQNNKASFRRAVYLTLMYFQLKSTRQLFGQPGSVGQNIVSTQHKMQAASVWALLGAALDMP